MKLTALLLLTLTVGSARAEFIKVVVEIPDQREALDAVNVALQALGDDVVRGVETFRGDGPLVSTVVQRLIEERAFVAEPGSFVAEAGALALTAEDGSFTVVIPVDDALQLALDHAWFQKFLEDSRQKAVDESAAWRDETATALWGKGGAIDQLATAQRSTGKAIETVGSDVGSLVIQLKAALAAGVVIGWVVGIAAALSLIALASVFIVRAVLRVRSSS